MTPRMTGRDLDELARACKKVIVNDANVLVSRVSLADTYAPFFAYTYRLWPHARIDTQMCGLRLHESSLVY